MFEKGGNSIKKFEMDMCSGSILKKMLIFTLPLMCSSILQLLFNAADVIVVGKFAGDNALAAVGSNTALINLLTNFFILFPPFSNIFFPLAVHHSRLLTLVSSYILY